MAGAGNPVVVTVKVPKVPMAKVAAAGLVMAGAPVTVSVKLWTAGAPAPLDAVKTSGKTPPALPSGVPARVAVPLPLSVKLTPAGSAPPRAMDGLGNPVVATVKEAASPGTKVAA